MAQDVVPDVPKRDAFALVIACSLAFFLLTLIAMQLYPGGRVGDRDSQGYSFFENFFSDLGQTHTHSGASNTPSLVLFCIAIGAMAIGLGSFFIAFARLFPRASRGVGPGRLAAVCGVVAGLCFIGVAATPWNLYLRAHNVFVIWAFRALLSAVLLDVVAVFISAGFPRRFGWVFVGFALVLAAYVGLLTFGPLPGTPAGALVHATGQKIIVYASVATIFVQSLLLTRSRRPTRLSSASA